MMDVMDRVMGHVEYDPFGGCWLWNSSLNPKGYGRVTVHGRQKQAHRVVFEAFMDTIPAGMELDHLCRVRCCVNPHHLEPVPGQVNRLRGLSSPAHNGLKECCPQGHPYSGANLVLYDGARNCRECGRVRRKEAKRVARALRISGQAPEPRGSRSDHTRHHALCSCGKIVWGNGGIANHLIMHERRKDGHTYEAARAYAASVEQGAGG